MSDILSRILIRQKRRANIASLYQGPNTHSTKEIRIASNKWWQIDYATGLRIQPVFLSSHVFFKCHSGGAKTIGKTSE